MDFFEQMLLIRRTEETLLDLYATGGLAGTTHTSIGQEACAVGVVSALDPEKDIVVSNHRCHGHFLAYGGSLESLLAEVMGKDAGVCKGVGGSQHLCCRNFYTNGIQGGMVPVATGMAMAEKLTGSGAVAAVFLGDGTLGQGVVYESFNMASLWGLPILFVIEANQYAQSTPTARALAGSMAERPRAFGIETRALAVESAEAVHAAATELVARIRQGGGPACLILETFRLAPHSKGDDHRPRALIREAAGRDPLNRLLASLPAGRVLQAEGTVRERLDAALAAASAGADLPGACFLALCRAGEAS